MSGVLPPSSFELKISSTNSSAGLVSNIMHCHEEGASLILGALVKDGLVLDDGSLDILGIPVGLGLLLGRSVRSTHANEFFANTT